MCFLTSKADGSNDLLTTLIPLQTIETGWQMCTESAMSLFINALKVYFVLSLLENGVYLSEIICVNHP